MNLEHTESIVNISQALFKAQTEMGDLVKNSDNPFFKSKYANLEAVLNVSEAALNDNKILVVQSPCGDGEHIGVVTMLIHTESGEYLKGSYVGPIAKSDPQAAGSAVTYARRYSLASMLNLVQVDDDAEGAMARQQPVNRDRLVIRADGCKDLGDLEKFWKSLDARERHEMKGYVKQLKKSLEKPTE
jgi:hypothetical protein